MQQTSTVRSFRQQFLELVTGSSVALLLSVLLMPIISRLYPPNEMGEFALYVAISSIAGILSNLRLDLAVVLANDDEEGAQLVWLAIGSTLPIGLFVFLGLSVLFPIGMFSILTAVSVTLIGSIQATAQWHNRQKRYRVLAGRNIAEKLTVLVSSLIFGFFAMTEFGLILGQTLGLIFSLIYFLSVSHLPAPHFSLKMYLGVLRKFSDFPLKNVFSSALLLSSMYVPSLLFASYFGKDILGHYNLVSRVFEIPVVVIANTFSTVYFQHTNNVMSVERKRLFGRTMRLLAIGIAPFFLAAAIWGESIFPFVFGRQWGMAGQFVGWVALFTLVRLFYVTQAPLLLVQRKMTYDLLISLFLFLSQVGGFFIGYNKFESPQMCVTAMAIIGGLVYVVGLLLVHRSLDINYSSTKTTG